MARTEEDDCLILASDGLWDVISNEVACEVSRKCLAINSRKKPEAQRITYNFSSSISPADNLHFTIITRLVAEQQVPAEAGSELGFYGKTVSVCQAFFKAKQRRSRFNNKSK
jgi:serine/threonine protein phosphatase PrpC